ncbi:MULTISPECIES: hypothetical protein [Novilysobacter]|uniref:hypothetical protein n=1 Tax=Novilysobacter TaxID=3382699 RepID=UPI002ED98904
MKQDDEWLDREGLYELVWSEPVSKLAPQFGLSGVGFAKMCKRMGVPLPNRGFWARKQAGQSPRRPPLPKAKPDQDQKVQLRRLTDDAQIAFSEAKQKAAEAKRAMRDIEFPSELVDPHPLIRAATNRLKRKTGWSHHKGLRSAPDEILNIEVTERSLDRALLIMDVLLKATAGRSGEVRINSEKKETLLRLDGVDLPITLTEHVGRTRHEITPEEKKAQERYWNRSYRDKNAPYPHIPQYDYHPSGQLTLTVGRCPSRTWRDTPRTQLEKRLSEIIPGIAAVAIEMRQREEEQAQAEAERQAAKDRYATKMKERSDERQAFRQLRRDARNWAMANQIRAYIDGVAQGKEHGALHSDAAAWAAWATQKAAWVDPMIKVSDRVLDAPEPERPSYWW